MSFGVLDGDGQVAQIEGHPFGQTGEENWHVLADPEGNEFCLLRTRVDLRPTMSS